MQITAINQKFNKAIQLNDETSVAEIGTLLLLEDSIFIKTNKSNIPMLTDWTKIQHDIGTQFIQDEYTRQLPLKGGIGITAKNGLDVNVDASTIKFAGNFHYGIGAPTSIQELLEYEIGLYLDIKDNSVYIWNPIKKIWAEPIRPFIVTSNKNEDIGFDSLKNTLNLPKFFSVPDISISKKIGLTATLSAKGTITASEIIKYNWQQISGNVNLSIANESGESTALFASAPGTAQVQLTVVDKNNIISHKNITLNFSYALQVLGTINETFSFQTLGEAFEWIRTYDIANEKKYYIEVFGATEEKFDILIPTQSTVYFKNGSITSGVHFLKGEYTWNGSNQAHIVLINTAENISIADGAKVTFNNISVTTNIIKAGIVVNKAELNLNNSIIISNNDTIIIADGAFKITNSVLTSTKGQSLQIIDSNATLTASTFTTALGDANISILNSAADITLCNISQNNISGSFNIYANNTDKFLFSITQSNIISMVKSDKNTDFIGNIFIKNDGETTLRYNTIVSKDSIALIVKGSGIKVTNNYLDGKFSFVANNNESFFEPDYLTIYRNLHFNELVGKFITKILDNTNYYEL